MRTRLRIEQWVRTRGRAAMNARLPPAAPYAFKRKIWATSPNPSRPDRLEIFRLSAGAAGGQQLPWSEGQDRARRLARPVFAPVFESSRFVTSNRL
jgi:hypothetical protein